MDVYIVGNTNTTYYEQGKTKIDYSQSKNDNSTIKQ